MSGVHPCIHCRRYRRTRRLSLLVWVQQGYRTLGVHRDYRNTFWCIELCGVEALKSCRRDSGLQDAWRGTCGTYGYIVPRAPFGTFRTSVPLRKVSTPSLYLGCTVSLPYVQRPPAHCVHAWRHVRSAVTCRSGLLLRSYVHFSHYRVP